MIHSGSALREEIRSEREINRSISIYDVFSATLVKHSLNLFYSGFGFAASHYGLPHIEYHDRGRIEVGISE